MEAEAVEQALATSARHLPDLLAPGQVEIRQEYIRVGEFYYGHLYIANLPREVAPGWLDPLLSLNLPHEVDFFLTPLDSRRVIARLQKQRRDFISTRLQDQKKGRVTSPELELGLEDVNALQQKLEAGTEKALKLDLLVTTWGGTPLETRDRLLQLRSAVVRGGADARSMPYRQLRGFRSLLPDGQNQVQRPKLVDATTVAFAFPFASTDLNMPGGVLFGVNAVERSPVIVNLWKRPELANPNIFIGGKPGAGKSFFTKTLLGRLLTTGVRAFVIDPENEYSRLAEAAGGRNIQLSSSRPFVFNIFQLPASATGRLEAGGETESERANPLAEKVATLLPLLTMLVLGVGDSRATSDLPREARDFLEHAVFETYRRCGITYEEVLSGRLTAPLLEQGTLAYAELLAGEGGAANNRQVAERFTRPRIPALADLRDTIRDLAEGSDFGLASALERYISGAFAGFFTNRPTTLDISDHLTVFKIRDVSRELQPIIILMAMDWVWSLAVRYRRPMVFVVDELWSVISSVAGGRLVESFARRSRKLGLSLVVATQQLEDLLSTEQGRAVLSCCDTKWIGQQEPHQEKSLREALKLTDEQVRFVLFQAQQGLALLKCGTRWVMLAVVHSEEEFRLAETNPVNGLPSQRNY